jgi:hypothetical protein
VSRCRHWEHYGKRSLHREEYSLVRVKPWALGEELFAESKKNNSRRRKNSRWRYSSPRAKKTLGEEILHREFFFSRRSNLKKSFFTFKLFYHQHALIQRIYSNLTQFYLCLLYLKILIHSR